MASSSSEAGRMAAAAGRGGAVWLLVCQMAKISLRWLPREVWQRHGDGGGGPAAMADWACLVTKGDEAVLQSVRSGAQLARFKSSGKVEAGCVAVEGGREGIFAAAAAGSLRVNVWALGREAPLAKGVAAEAITALAVSFDGTYVVGGSAGKIFVWRLASGALLASWDAHFHAVSALSFMGSDSSVLASAGKDGLVAVWRLSEVFDALAGSDAEPAAWRSFSEHALPVTAMRASACGSRLYSVSMDRTCKVWDVASGSLMASLAMPAALTALAVDPAESHVYLGAIDGNIYCADARSDAAIEQGSTLVGHTDELTALAVSVDGALLVSAAKDKLLKVWNTDTRQLIRTHPTGPSPATNVVVLARSAEAVGGAASAVADAHVAPLKKYKEVGDAARVAEVWMR